MKFPSRFFTVAILLSFCLINGQLRIATQEDIGYGEGTQKSYQGGTVTVTPGSTPDQLWKAFNIVGAPAGVTNLSVSTTTFWSTPQWGIYQNIPPINNIQLKDGIVLTSGKAEDCRGPNNSGSKTTNFGYPGDPDLVGVVGENVFDAATLIVDFTCDATVKGFSFDFCFGTEEYPEYVGKFNDAFVCLFDGVNICKDNLGNIISVNNAYFGVINTPNPVINLQWDGFTYVLKTSKVLTPGKHRLKFAVGDTKDGLLDAGVFLSDFKFSITDTGTNPVIDLIGDQTFSVLEKSPPQTLVGYVKNLPKNKTVKLEALTPVPEFDITTAAWVDSTSWPIKVANGAVLDFDVTKQYLIKLRAQLGSKYDTATMTINILENKTWPPAKTATIFDKDGNGKADSVLVEFMSNVPASGFDYKTADFTWPQGQNTYSVKISATNVFNSKFLSFSYDPTAAAPIWTMGKSTIQCKFDSLGTELVRPADLNEQIGPVLTVAKVVKRFKPMPDTFRVTISEPVNVSAISGKSFILIKKGHVKEIEIGPIAGTMLDLGGESVVQFLIDDLLTDAPAEGDSLKILSTGPVIDKVSMMAHKNNPPVPILFVDGMLDACPQIATAVMYDKNGDGKGDSVRVEFKANFIKQIPPKKADFSWPENQQNYTQSVSASNISGDRIISFSFAPQANAPVWTKGSSTITVFLDSMGTEIKRAAPLTDGIGPLLADAAVIKRYQPKNDTFRVHTTEPVQVSQIAGKSFILVRKDHTAEVELTVIGPVKDLNGATFLEFAAGELSNAPPVAGDSLKILGGSTVTDVLNNKAHKDNTPVPLRFLDNTVPVKVACYYDVNGDGIVDRVGIKFVDTLKKLDSITFSITWAGEAKKIPSPSFASGAKDSVILDLKGTFDVVDKTSGDMTLTLTYTGTGDNAEYPVEDKAGPVITRAVYYPKNFSNRAYAGKDLLTVTFSEGMGVVASEKPFTLIDSSSGSTYYFTFDPAPVVVDTSKITFSVKSIQGVAFPEEGDKIRINAQENVKDALGILQGVAENKLVRLEIVQPPFDFDPYVIGPLSRNDKKIPEKLKIGTTIDSGTTILLKPRIHVPIRILEQVTCDIQIYDALGNLISRAGGRADGKGVNTREFVLGAKEVVDLNGKRETYIVILWADRNSQTRPVGNGLYLGIIRIVTSEGATTVKKVYIPNKG